MQSRRYALSDEQWEVVELLLPARHRVGRPRNNDRLFVDAVLSTGAAWRDLPERFVSYKSVYGRFNRWSEAGVFDAVLRALNARLQADGRLDPTWCIDATTIRANKAASGGGKKGGPTSRNTTISDEAEAG